MLVFERMFTKYNLFSLFSRGVIPKNLFYLFDADARFSGQVRDSFFSSMPFCDIRRGGKGDRGISFITLPFYTSHHGGQAG
jgi:hypothetical protein